MPRLPRVLLLVMFFVSRSSGSRLLSSAFVSRVWSGSRREAGAGVVASPRHWRTFAAETSSSGDSSSSSGSGGSGSSGDWSREALQKLTVPKLKDILRAAGQPVSGRKADLVDRVLAPAPPRVRAKPAKPAATPYSTSASSALGREDPRPVIERDPTPRRRPLIPLGSSDDNDDDDDDDNDDEDGSSSGGGGGGGNGKATTTRALGPNTLRLVSWNVNGLRALLRRPEPLARLLAEERPHVLCLQETKLQEAHVADAAAALAEVVAEATRIGSGVVGGGVGGVGSGIAGGIGGIGGGALRYDMHWACSGEGGSGGRKGYSGVAVLVEATAASGEGPRDGRLLRAPRRVVKGVGEPEADAEGRCLTLLWDDTDDTDDDTDEQQQQRQQLAVATVYVPNSGEGLRRLDYRCGSWDPALARHLESLAYSSASSSSSSSSSSSPVPGRRVLVCGDFNVAFEDADFFNPHEKRMAQQAGTTPRERASFGDLFLADHHQEQEQGAGEREEQQEQGGGGGGGLGFGDTFRAIHGGLSSTPASSAAPPPPPRGVFSYWSQRARNRAVNRGLRLDYFLASPAALGHVSDAFVRDDITGSDHCPVGVDIEMPPGFVLNPTTATSDGCIDER